MIRLHHPTQHHMRISPQAVLHSAAYLEACKCYSYVEHACTFVYAVNSFTYFEIGKRVADGALIIMLFVLLTGHAIRKAGHMPLRLKHFLDA